MVKALQRVRFGEVLDMAPYCAYGGNSFEGRRRRPGPVGRRDDGTRMSYRLMSVIEHWGSAFGGHYQTYRRVGSGRDDWVLVSDESVSSWTWEDVRGCEACMLLYVACRQTDELSQGDLSRLSQHPGPQSRCACLA